MSRIEKTVFISYRRTNFYTALAVYQDLTLHGYDVFFDFQSIDSGDFEKIITENIKAKAHFVIILSPSALERCNEPGDWLRREIEMAMDEKRNIIPLMMEGFDFGSPSVKQALLGKLGTLNHYNGLRLVADYFFEAMEKLRKRYLNVALEDIYIHPLNPKAKEITEANKLSTNEAEPVEINQLTAEEWYERGFVYHDDKNYDEAIRCYTEAIRLKPDFYEAYGNRGNAKKDFLGALSDYDEAIRIKPDYANAYYNRALTRKANNDLQGALADFDETIRLKPDDNEAYYNRALTRKTNNDLQGALADFGEAIRLMPGDDEAYYNRSIIFSIIGDTQSSLRDLQKASELKPEDGVIRASLVRVLRSLGQKQESENQEKLARELIATENEYNQACFEAVCGNIEKALVLLQKALEKDQLDKLWARQDLDFENLRDDPRFKELVGE